MTIGSLNGSSASAETRAATDVTRMTTPIAQATQRERCEGGRPSGNSSRISAVRPSKGTNAKLFTQATGTTHPGAPVLLGTT